MTELNQNDLSGAAPDVAWPELPLSGAEDSSAVSDGAVQEVLRRVRDVPGLQVSEHPDAYTDMHDALLEALNQDTSSVPGAAPRPGAA
ncbi:hypothetical protein ABFP37_16630 [Burkholderia sp. RS01]|uniref:hypothetical protein n=1 Tax=unclassified Burkholderia TaxID=2613784 RepID=UPI0032183D06